MSRPRRTPARHRSEGLPTSFPNAAGIDSSADQSVVAVPPDRDPQPMRVFRTFTPDLEALVAWLLESGIDSVAIVSTGLQWLPLYQLLEQQGIVPYLVNGRQVKSLPGRKSDWNDAQWLQKLHTLGLLRASVRRDLEIAALRTLTRYRAELIADRAPHSLHMHKALQQMTIQLERVLSEIRGTSGQAIIRASVAGERDPIVLAQLRKPGCKSSEETIAKALSGTWKAELLFVVTQALVIYDVYTAQIAVCDGESEQYLQSMDARGGDPHAALPDLPPAKRDLRSKRAPSFTARAHSARLVGVD